jgi:hypothetical protein
MMTDPAFAEAAVCTAAASARDRFEAEILVRGPIDAITTKTETIAAFQKRRHPTGAERSASACHLPSYQLLILASSSGSTRLQYICGRNFSSMK